MTIAKSVGTTYAAVESAINQRAMRHRTLLNMSNKPIAYAVHCFNHRLRSRLINLLPQQANVRSNCFGRYIAIHSPNTLDQSLAPNKVSGVLHQELKQAEFSRHELNFLISQ